MSSYRVILWYLLVTDVALVGVIHVVAVVFFFLLFVVVLHYGFTSLSSSDYSSSPTAPLNSTKTTIQVQTR